MIILIIGLAFALLIIATLVMGIWVMPWISMKNARNLLKGHNPTTEYMAEDGKTYYARYELTNSEWKVLEGKLGSFVLKRQDTFIDPFYDLFTEEERAGVSSSYLSSSPVPLTLNKRYCWVNIIPVPSDNGVSVFIYIMLPVYGKM